MTTCCECGSSIGPEENFCGGCGARRQRDDTPVVSNSGSVSSTDHPSGIVPDYSQKLVEDGSTWTEEEAPTPVDKNRGTGELGESAEFSSKTSRADAVPDKRPKPKALAGGKILT